MQLLNWKQFDRQWSSSLMVAVGGRPRSKSSYRWTIVSRASSNGMLVKSDTTSNDTMHSLGAMVVRLMLVQEFQGVGEAVFRVSNERT